MQNPRMGAGSVAEESKSILVQYCQRRRREGEWEGEQAGMNKQAEDREREGRREGDRQARTYTENNVRVKVTFGSLCI